MTSNPRPSDTPCLGGTHNFRSLAGVTTADGRQIAAHKLLRSDRLSRLSEADWQQLAAIGLRTICDLRGQEEIALAPTLVPAGLPLRMLQLDIRNDVRSDRTLSGQLGADPTEAGARRVMLTIYARFPEAMAPRLPALFEALCSDDAGAEDGAPLLVHCAAGKDRTGFVIALLLHALGVPYEAVMADYLRAPPSLGLADPRLAHLQQHFRGQAGFDLPAEVLLPVLAVDPAYLDTAWQALDHNHGGADAYLLQTAGLTAERRERLRERLLTSP